MHLARLTDAAAADLGLSSPAMLYHRFVTWTLERDHTCRACGKRDHDALPGLPPRFVPCGKLRQTVAAPVVQSEP
jgi:hypothetical protein